MEKIADMFPDNAYQLLGGVQNVLLPKLKKEIAKAQKAIESNPSYSGKTMNDWFKQFN